MASTTAMEEARTLWIGDLQSWAEESYLSECFGHSGEVVSIKIIRNKMTGQAEGYGFIEFVSHAAAESFLRTYNGTQMPGTEHTFTLNWPSSGDAGPHLNNTTVCIGSLDVNVTEEELKKTFMEFGDIASAKIYADKGTSLAKKFLRTNAQTILSQIKRQDKEIQLKRRCLLAIPPTKSERKKIKKYFKNRYLSESIIREDDIFYESVRTHVEDAIGVPLIEQENHVPQDDVDQIHTPNLKRLISRALII